MRRLVGIWLLMVSCVAFADELISISPDEAKAIPMTTPVVTTSDEPMVTGSSQKSVVTVTDKPVVDSEDESAPVAMKHFYVRGDLGVLTPVSRIRDNTPLLADSKFRTTVLYSIGGGYRYSDFLRTDINFQYRRFNYKKDDSIDTVKQVTNSYVVFWNGYLDAKNKTIFTPYLTGGVGYSRLSPGDALDSGGNRVDVYSGKINTNFAWNGGGGLRVKISEGFDVDMAYRYVRLGRINFDQSTFGHSSGEPFLLKTHEVTLGLAYNF